MKFLQKISILPVFILVFIGCASNKSISQNDVFGLKVENISKGIQLTFNSIPAETTRIFITIDNGNSAPILTEFKGAQLEQLKKTGKVICPFVQQGHHYNIYANLYNGINEIDKINTEITAKNGIQILNDITLGLNETQNELMLSSEPVFSANVDYDFQKYSYMITLFLEETTDWNKLFEDNFLDRIYEKYPEIVFNVSINDVSNNSIRTNDLLACFKAFCRLNYDNIVWEVGIAKSNEVILIL
jgi:hypothetical protein